MPIIVTGFDGFGPHDINPSQQAVEALANNLVSSKPGQDKPLFVEKSNLQTLVLPTSSSRGWATLKETLAKLSPGTEPILIVMCGVAQERKKIGLERFAINVRDYRIPDNDGNQLCDQAIDVDAQLAYKCQLPLAQLRDHLIAKGFASEVSNHAGSYICNEVYFQCLQALQEQKEFKHRACAAVFVHLPLPRAYTQVDSKNANETQSIVIPSSNESQTPITELDYQEVIKIYSLALEEIIRWSQGFLTERSC
jgi:pyroglutamyl-peptidase